MEPREICMAQVRSCNGRQAPPRSGVSLLGTCPVATCLSQIPFAWNHNRVHVEGDRKSHRAGRIALPNKCHEITRIIPRLQGHGEASHSPRQKRVLMHTASGQKRDGSTDT